MSIRLSIRLLSSLLLLAPLAGQDRWAPHAVAGPVNQLIVSGNACGPAALLTAFRCGDENTRQAAAAIPGTSDRERLLHIIRAHGLKPSISLRNRTRWTRHGINPEDLHAIATELATASANLTLKSHSLHAAAGIPGTRTLRHSHQLLRDSLARGFPPVLSIRRYTLRDGQWLMLDGHFITIVRVPEKIDRQATSFALTYFEPWGAKKREANLVIPKVPFLTEDPERPGALGLDAPLADVGKSKVRRGETTILAASFLIAR